MYDYVLLSKMCMSMIMYLLLRSCCNKYMIMDMQLKNCWEIARRKLATPRYASSTVDSVQRLEERLRVRQTKALNALLKRIQRDRGEQVRVCPT